MSPARSLPSTLNLQHPTLRPPRLTAWGALVQGATRPSRSETGVNHAERTSRMRSTPRNGDVERGTGRKACQARRARSASAKREEEEEEAQRREEEGGEEEGGQGQEAESPPRRARALGVAPPAESPRRPAQVRRDPSLSHTHTHPL